MTLSGRRRLSAPWAGARGRVRAACVGVRMEVQRVGSHIHTLWSRVLRDGDPSGFGIAAALKEMIILGYVALDFRVFWE